MNRFCSTSHRFRCLAGFALCLALELGSWLPLARAIPPPRPGGRSGRITRRGAAPIGSQGVTSQAVLNVLRLPTAAKYRLRDDNPELFEAAVAAHGAKAVSVRIEALREHHTDYQISVPFSRGGYRVPDQGERPDCWQEAWEVVIQGKLRAKGLELPRLSLGWTNRAHMSARTRAVIRKMCHRKEPQHWLEAQVSKYQATALVSGGGWFPWMVELLKTNGAVPELSTWVDVGSEYHQATVDSEATEAIWRQLHAAIAQTAVRLARVNHRQRSARTHIATEAIQEVEAYLDLTFGRLPKRLRVGSSWPQTYRTQVMGLTDQDLDYVMLLNDPRMPGGWNRRLRVAEFGAPGMEPFDVVNVSIDRMYEAIRATLERAQEPVWIAASGDFYSHPYYLEEAQARLFGHEARSVLSRKLFEPELVHATPLPSKSVRSRADLLFPADHAMTILEMDPVAEKFLLLNSHGEWSGHDGHIHAYWGALRDDIEMAAVPGWVLPNDLREQINARPRKDVSARRYRSVAK